MKMRIIAVGVLTIGLCLSCSTEELDSSQNELTNEVKGAEEKIALQPIQLSASGDCGTVISTLTPSWVNDNYAQYTNSFDVLPPINVQVKYHIVRTDDGLDGIPLSDLDAMTQQLNNDFEQPLYGCVAFNHSPSRIRFVHNGDVNYIDVTNYQIIDTSTSDTSLIALEYDALIAKDNDRTMINIYIIKGFNVPSTIPIYSKAAMNGNTVVVVRDQDAHKSPYLTHGVGHNFGLYHTYYRNSTCDLKLNGCDGAIGDYIEDTPIVTSLSIFNINQYCEVRGRSSANCNGTPIYIPDENVLFNSKNIMTTRYSSSITECRIGFTGMQHIRMNQQVIALGLEQSTRSIVQE